MRTMWRNGPLPWIMTTLVTIIFLYSSLGHAQITGESVLGQLETDIGVVSSQIREAEKENTCYSGGLVKTLIVLRLQILKNTKAMLEQRKYALIHAIPVHYTYKDEVYVPTPADSATIQSIESDIQDQEKRLVKAETENEKYAGGLVKAMILSEISTIKNTIAMLEQQKVIAKYGIPLPAFQVEDQPQVEEPSVRPSPAPERKLEIIDIQTRVTESNPSWSKYAWRLTVKNQSSSLVMFDAIIEFQDEDGFVIDEDRAYDLSILGGQRETFTGYALIDASVADNVAKITAKVSYG